MLSTEALAEPGFRNTH